MDNKKVLNSETIVFGFFNGIGISFAISDCTRTDFCIKITLNLPKVGKKQIDEVPKITCIGDSRLTLTNVSKSEIRDYFSEEKTTKNETKPETKNINFQKKTSSTNNKDFRSREARRHVMAH